jgi:hypothetical protein
MNRLICVGDEQQGLAIAVGREVVDERRVAADWYDMGPGRGCTLTGAQPYDDPGED